jgi:predicted NBD/HSP70 family sugar kinase
LSGQARRTIPVAGERGYNGSVIHSNESRSMNLDTSAYCLADRPVPDLIPAQIERFTVEALQGKQVRSFDPHAALDQLRTGGEESILAVDIGGDKLIAVSYRVRNGQLVQLTEILSRQGDGGSAYLACLEDLADLSRREMFSVGISFAGPTDVTRPSAAPNLPIFMAELNNRHDGDFVKLFPMVAVANDAEAGIMAGSVEAAKRYPGTRHVIYLINGSGLGGAVLTGNMVFATEPGHIPVVGSLNRFDQQKPCGMLGADYVCIETVAASKAGIEDIWLQQRGNRLSGKEIAARYLSGDILARDLYENSALVTAHAIRGIARAFGLPNNFDETVVVVHGGIFEVPGYRDRVRSILEKDLPSMPRLLSTKDFSANTCLDGAAIAAAISGKQAYLRLSERQG